jgi:nucleotide-binding universal stress UspA family protein
VTETFEILLASDFSARSQRPRDRAVLLAQDLSARLAVAHVVEGKTDADDGDAVREVEARLRADLADAAAAADLIVRHGKTPEVLGQIVAERGSDVVVTGVARYNDISDFLLGTTVAHIIRSVERPVLVVRKQPKGPYRNIVVTTDFSPYAREALLYAMRLFPAASFTVLHAYNVPFQGWLTSDDAQTDLRDEHQQYMDKFMAETPVPEAARSRVAALLQDGELNGVVMRAIESLGADLLVLGMRTRGEGEAALGSHIESLLTIADADALVVRGL